MFTRQHYKKIAYTLSQVSAERYEDTRGNADESKGSAETIGAVIRHLSHMFEIDNPSFDAEKFLDAAQGRFELL